MRQKELRHPDLWYQNVYRPAAELSPALSRQLGGDLSGLGVDPSNAYFDPRTGRWGTLIVTQPLLPGSGVGNNLQWSDLGLSAPPSGEELAQTAAAAFRRYLERHVAELRIDPEELLTPRAQAFGSRVIQVHAGRQIDGIPVRGAFVSATINSGNLVLLATRAWGEPTLALQPSIAGTDAENTLSAHLEGIPVAGYRKPPRLEIVPLSSQPDESLVAFGAGLEHRLTWVLTPQFTGDPVARWEALVDAHGGELLAFQDTAHYAARRVEGAIYPVSNDGVPPDGVLQDMSPLPFADIALDGVPMGYSTTGGNLPPGLGTGTISTALSGRYLAMNDNCGPVDESSASGDLDLEGVDGTDCDVPAGHSAGDTNSTRSGYYEINRIMEQARGYLPDNGWLDTTLNANMNIVATCNASWNGSVNFFRSGGGCSNTGELAGVFDHEWGHGMDNNDATGSVSNPGEGIADIFAANRLNTSCMGRNFRPGNPCNGYGDACTECTGVRDIDWAKRVSGQPHGVAWIDANCGGGPSPCGGSVHCEGAVYSEAVWDLVHRDFQGHEGSPFDFDVNTALELGTRLTYYGSSNVGNWYQCTTNGEGGCNADGGYLNYLAADDDNGNLTDGTPHMSAIFAAFDRHQIACPTPTVQNSGCAGGPAAAPTTVVATPLNEGAHLSWDAVAGASEYWIYRTEGVHGCDFGKSLVGKTTSTEFVEFGLKNDFEVLYGVVAVGDNDACTGPMSACEAVSPVPGPGLGFDAGAPEWLGQTGDGDGFFDNCETGDLTFNVSNTGIGALTNVRIVEASISSHPEAEVLTTLPATIAANLPEGDSAVAQLEVRGGGFAFNDTLTLEVTVTSDELDPLAIAHTYTLTALESDLQEEANLTFSFEDGDDGWQLVSGIFDRTDAAPGGANGTAFYRASSSGLDLNCDRVRSPIVQLTSSSTLEIYNQFDIEPFSGGFWWDRANLGVFDPLTGERTIVSPDGGRTYNASGSNPAPAPCASHQPPEAEGWAGPGPDWLASTWTPAALGSPDLNGQLIQLDFAYGTDPASTGSIGFWFDEVTLTDVSVQVPDAQPDVCGGLPVLALDPSSLDFGDVPVGETSAPQVSTLSNSGDTDATGLVFSGLPDAGFAVDTSACGATLPAGASCAVSVTFAPTAPGSATATLHVASDEGATADLGLAGNGVGGGGGPVADIQCDSLDFELPPGGGETRNCDVGNLGDLDLTWSIDEAEGDALVSGVPYAYGLAEMPPLHAPQGYSRASGKRPAATDAPADRVVLPAPQTGVIDDLSENFDDIDLLAGAGWALINNSEPAGPSSWFQGNDTFPAHEGDPTSYIAANYDSTGDNGDISNWLITPELTIENGTQLTFWTRKADQFQDFYDRMEVRLSTAGDSTDVGDTAESVGDFTELLLAINPDFDPEGYPEVWTQFVVTVSGLSEPASGRFAFRYWVTDSGAQGENGDFIGIDTVSVAQTGACANPLDIPWLSTDPTSGTTPPAGSVPVDVSVDATGLDEGDYSARLCFSTNDSTTPLVELPVSLTVAEGGLGPIADITPESFSFEVPEGASDSDILNVGNIGDADLIWSLDEAADGLAARSAAHSVPYGRGLAEMPAFHAPQGHSRASGIRPSRDAAPADRRVLPAPQASAFGGLIEGFDDISQLPDFGWSMINNSEPAGPSSWFQGNDTFPAHEGDPTSYIAANYDSTGDNGDISNWLITPVLTIENGTQLTFWTRKADQFQEYYDRMEVRLSTAGDSTDVGDTAESVGDFTELLLSINPDLEPEGYPEVWTQFVVTVSGLSEPATGRFAFRYWVTDSGAQGSNGDFIGIDTVSVDQTGGGNCTSPTDIPWLSTDPTSGTTVPAGSVPVDVTVDASTLAPGTYSALICATTNDPAAPLVEVPVSLTVTEGDLGPIADITPESFSFEVPEGASDSDILNVGNIGDADLTWSLAEAADGLAARSAARSVPYGRGLAEMPAFHAPQGHSRASGIRPSRDGVPADRRVLPAAQVSAFGGLNEGFDDINALPGFGWSMINNSEPAGPSSWFQGNDTFPAHEGDPTSYIAANYDSTGDNGDISNWLITPVLTIENGTQLTFWTRKADQFLNYYDRMEVRLSTAGDSIDVGDTAESVGDFTELLLSINPDLEPEGYPEVWTQFVVTVSGLTEPATGRFAFRYWVTDSGAQGSNGDFIGIDTVSVDQTGGGNCTSPTDIPWLSTDPTSGTTVPAGSVPVDVTVDASTLAPGTYSALICATTNDPAALLVEVPVSLTVTEDGLGPIADITPESFSFEVPEGASDSDILNVGNIGDADLTWSLAEAADGGGGGDCVSPTDIPWLSTDPTSGTTPPAGNVPVDVTVDASTLAPGTYSALICATTNDPAAPLVEVPVDLTVTPAGPVPVIDVDPESLASTLEQGQSETHALTISNLGGADLDWTIEELDGFATKPHAGADIVVFDDINFVPPETTTGGSVRWDTGETCECDDAPFNFNVWTTGGLASFFWPTIDGEQGGGVSLDGTTYAVLEPGATVGPDSTFVSTLSSDAAANWRQADGVDGYLGFRFINPDTGVTNFGYAHITTTGTTGHPVTILGWAYNQVGDPITIEQDNGPQDCSEPVDVPWLAVDPTSGTTLPSASSPVEVTVDTTGLDVGEHVATLCIESNDPVTPVVLVPVTLTVTPGAAPIADISPASFSFELVEGESGGDTLNVGNIGDADLVWSLDEAEGAPLRGAAALAEGGSGGDCASPTDIPWLSTDPTSGTTPPAGSVPVNVAVDASALAAGDYTALLCVTTNDPAAPMVPVPVTLTVTEAPVVAYTATALVVDPTVYEPDASNGNGVFQPNETVDVMPVWRNDGSLPQSLNGTASNYTGPAGPAYTLVDDGAAYGEVAPGEASDCMANGSCYAMGVDDPVTRPSVHWDATFDELLDDPDGTGRPWTLHIGNSFTDVPDSNLFFATIENLLHSRITGGCTVGEFCPASNITRGQMAVFMLRGAEDPDYNPPACVEGATMFDDVPFDSLFCSWIEELARRNVTAGCDADSYCPGDPVTRAQMSVFLIKSIEGGDYTPPTCDGIFTDVGCPSLFGDWIEDLYNRQITEGCTEDPLAYCPVEQVSRGQMSAFVVKAFDLLLYGP